MSELANRRFNDNYTYMLSRIEQYLEGALQTSHAGKPLRAFGLSHEILLTLFGIATRSRDTLVRRRALLMASQLHIQENLVDSDFLAAVMERIIDIEENAARNLKGLPPNQLLKCEDVPEAARFMDANVSMLEGTGNVARLIVCGWAAPGDEELTLREYQFKLGGDGVWSEGMMIPEGAFPQKMI